LNGYSDLAHFSRTVDPTECTAPLGAACNASNRPLDAAPNDPALAVAIGEHPENPPRRLGQRIIAAAINARYALASDLVSPEKRSALTLPKF
jgi:hypothetical protein